MGTRLPGALGGCSHAVMPMVGNASQLLCVLFLCSRWTAGPWACCFTPWFTERCPSMVSITKTSFGRSAVESTGSPRSPQVRALWRVQLEGSAHLPGSRSALSARPSSFIFLESCLWHSWPARLFIRTLPGAPGRADVCTAARGLGHCVNLGKSASWIPFLHYI